jgi:hypothetical protein
VTPAALPLRIGLWHWLVSSACTRTILQLDGSPFNHGPHQPFTLDPSRRSSTSQRGSRSWKSAIAGPQLSSKPPSDGGGCPGGTLPQAVLGREAGVAVGGSGRTRVGSVLTGRSLKLSAQSNCRQWRSRQAASQGCRNRLNRCVGQPVGQSAELLNNVCKHSVDRKPCTMTVIATWTLVCKL